MSRWSNGVPWGHSPVLHCASLLSIILCVISVRALENGGFFFTAGPRQKDKSSISRKQLWWTIIFVVVLNWVVNFSTQNKYGPILSVEQKTIVGNVNLASNRDYNHVAIIMIYMGINKVLYPKRTWWPLIFISKFKVVFYWDQLF